jgi:hypothetical protein
MEWCQEMTGKKLDIGTVLVTFHDDSSAEVHIYKQGSTILIDNVSVHWSNARSMLGVIAEIGLIRNKGIKKWEWIQIGKDHTKLKF